MVFYTTFEKYVSYIVTVNFIDRGKQSPHRMPPTCCKSKQNNFEIYFHGIFVHFLDVW
jgi:hypothetical protein